MSTFKEITSADIKTSRSFLNQLVDIVQEDISGSATRRSRYQVFVTGGIGPGVTSSLFHTVHDQAFSLQTANPMFDMTVGLFTSSSIVNEVVQSTDSFGKKIFPSSSLMMREKINVYKQFAQLLLGNSEAQFTAPVNSIVEDDRIDSALFICFKRLFARDQIKRETFAMKIFQSASHETGGSSYNEAGNLSTTSENGPAIFVDVGSATSKLTLQGGNVGNVVNAANTAETAGLIFYDRGVAVFDLSKLISGSQHVSGTVSAMSPQSYQDAPAGRTVIGDTHHNKKAKFIPDFLTSGSIDDIVDHIASCRFQSGSNVAITFQNVTNINSSLIFCRATADEFNYSSNPSYIDSDNRIVVIDEGQEEIQRAFTFITTVGLYDDNNNLLAVAKLSRPVEKNDEKDVTFRVRLDF